MQKDLPLKARDAPRSMGLSVIARWVMMVFFWAVPLVGHAACSLKPYDGDFPFSDAALGARDAFFASLCDESFAELVIFPDPRLKDRFRPPFRQHAIEEAGYPERAHRLGLEGKTVVAFVIEADGSVAHSVVIQSSGHQMLDEAAVASEGQVRFDIPGSLDGIPVRVLVTREINFKMTGEGARLSTAFSDDYIAALGIHLIDLCNGGDFNTLYDDLDEAGKRRTSRMDIKQLLRIYEGLYGDIATARYEGILREDMEEGTKVYELAYALDLVRPGAENVLLAVTLAEHEDGLRMTSFWIDRRMTIRLPHHERAH